MWILSSYVLVLVYFLIFCKGGFPARNPPSIDSKLRNSGQSNHKRPVVERYTLQSFPRTQVALHMPCNESNMFATKCMCHYRCTDAGCDNAVRLCEKYSDSKGCRYMFLRGGEMNRFVTLKRVPTAAEWERFNISSYPHSMNEIKSSSMWRKIQLANEKAHASRKMNTFGDMVTTLGSKGESIMDQIFTNPLVTNNKSKYCRFKYWKVAEMNSSTLQMIDATKAADQKHFLANGVSLVALSYQAPRTLLNSMKTWRQSGLLEVVAEKIIILNDPSPEEYAIALEFGFKIVEPQDIPGAKMSFPNVLTISAAFYYALKLIKTDYLLFLENDFKMDVDLPKGRIEEEFLAGAGLLLNGIDIVRLISRKDKGCGTFKECDHEGIHFDAPRPVDRLRNWFAFYCKGRPGSEGYVSDCFEDPLFRCFTSWDTNWTLNAVLLRKSSILKKKYRINQKSAQSIPEIAISQWEKQDGFESVMAFSHPWAHWKVPICISYNGLFLNEEIETGA